MANIHFVGIGGIGLSALAQFFLSRGNKVAGSDIKASVITDFLKQKGIKIYIGHNEGNINAAIDLMVYSAAVNIANNPEIQKAKKMNIKILSYAEALSQLTKDFFTIAISGSHGKSTTTSILALVLIEAGFDPTVIVGTKLKELGNSNFRLGKSKYLVIEADEYNKSFLNYKTDIIVVTNIDKEHLDTYKNINDIIENFALYFSNLKPKGFLIVNKKDKNSLKSLKIYLSRKRTTKTIFYNQKKPNFNLLIPGDFNKVNAEAAFTATRVLGIKENIARKSIENYSGSWRRMEILKKEKNRIFMSDYAHHSTEIKETLKALKDFYKNRKIIVVFQPHQLQRLNLLFNDFVKAFEFCDELIILPVFRVKGREKGDFKKDSKNLFKAIKKHRHKLLKNIEFAENFESAIAIINKIQQPRQNKIGRGKPFVAVFMGAGDIDEKIRNFLQ